MDPSAMITTESATLPLRSGSALLVEDEPLQLDLMVELVMNLGFKPMVFATADDALRFIQDGREDVRLLLTDFYTPGEITGGDLAARAVALLPGLPAIVVSGKEDVSDKVGSEITFMPKPWSAQALSQLILRLTLV
jgi:DNA-binding NtrC family response regulator